MDTEYLIDLVYERKPLWDQRCRSYHNREISRRLWAEIADELGVPTNNVKAKWKGLRDTYRREWQKGVRSGNVKEDNVCSSWPMFSSLKFLSDHLIWKGSSENIPTQVKSDTAKTEYGKSDAAKTEDKSQDTTKTERLVLQSEREDYIEEGCSRIVRKPGYQVAAKKCRLDKESDLRDIEQDKINSFQAVLDKKHKESRDYDYHFFMGLLTHMTKVKPDRKISVQLQMQQLLLNELSMNSTNSMCTSTPSTISSPNTFTEIQTLLQQTQDKFQAMSEQIITRIDEMGTRIDDLEKNISDLMTQAGVEGPEK